MANAWDDFWGSLTKPIKGGEGGYQAYGNWDSKKDPIPDMTMKGISNNPFQQGQAVGMNASRPQPSRSIGAIRDAGKLPGLSQDNSSQPRFANKMLSDEAAYREPEEDPLDKLNRRRAELEAMLDEDFTGDPEMDALVEQAYASALSNIGNARNSANDNFAKSDANIAALSAGHVREIETKDRDAVNRIAGDYQGGLQNTYNTAKNDITADRSAEMAEKTAMLERLGIQEAGLGDAGQDETQALDRLTQNQAGAMRQAQGYQAADQTRNVEQAQSQASAGVERRSALNSDLQKILGGLNESEAELQSQKSQSMLQARSGAKNDYLDRMGAISDSIGDIDDRIDSKVEGDRDYALELRKLAQKESGGGGSAFDAVSNDLATRGIDPAPYLQYYSEVAGGTGFNSAVDGDKTLWMVRNMKKKAAEKGVKLDDVAISRFVNGLNNYGTDKLGN